ncbi:hypothetical protein HN873_059167 [Arachis hypogaea]|uniref:Exocyst subunit Exo70 family protein n=1 Tax=Arachis hypogaea TaxID=3818 RepID=A0A444YBD1_ARAHY|nr:hypothetical protein Ahy_B07g087145 [Arachis hypogaea]
MASLVFKIQRWLKQPKVWRFVGFASTVIGLLFYAMSSAFNSLFGEWNLLKTFLYSVLSFIICVTVLFAKAWEHSSNLRIKAHMAFFVLTITSFYSFFFDKAAKGKPDAYGLVSCAAFAVMSLSLSRRTRCGFEVDMLYFFLGALIVQLMKIKWVLGIAGAGFSYFLIVLFSWLDDPQPEENGYIELQDQPQVIIQVGSLQPRESNASSGSAPVSTQPEANIQDQATIDGDSHSQKANADFALIKPHLLVSLKALKKQNQKIFGLLYGQSLVDSIQHDHNLFTDVIPLKIINRLNGAVKIAAANGFEKEWCQLYSSCRREFLHQCLSKLELEDLNNIDKNTLDRISSWREGFRIAIHKLFPAERRLCNRVFFGFSSLEDLTFMLICKELTVYFLNFANTVANTTPFENSWRSTLASQVEMFRGMCDMIPGLESVFPDQHSALLKIEAMMTRQRLGEKIRDVFKDMENLICCDSAIVDVVGDVDVLTYNIMYGLSVALRNWDIIEKALIEYPMGINKGGSYPSLSSQIARIVELLDNHLEAKCKTYTDPALGHVAMLNNVTFITQRVLHHPSIARFRSDNYSSANIWDEDWMKKCTAKIRQNLEDYKRSSWNELLGLLKLDNNESLENNVAAESMKEKLKLFNVQFEEICCTQSKWFARDDIRKEIIVSVENILLPAYGSFVGRLQDVLGKAAYDYIQYGMLDIQDRLNRLFLGDKRMSR